MNIDPIIGPPESQKLKAGRITLSPGEEIGEHVTEKREEILIVLKGTVTLMKEGETIQLREGETHFIKEGVRHNTKNETQTPLEYIYVVSSSS